VAARTAGATGLGLHANRVLSLVPNLLADVLIRGIALVLLGSHEVRDRAVAAVIPVIEQHYAADFGGARVVQLSPRAGDLLSRLYGRVLAATWCSTVYLMPGALAYAEDGLPDPESLDTLAHELWHVHQFRSSGGGLPWVLRWVREQRRYGGWDMPIEAEAREMAAGFLRRWQEHHGPRRAVPGAQAEG